MKKTAGILVLFAIAFVINLLYHGGVFRSINPHFEGTVSTIKGISGVEDITIDQATGLAFLSADNRRATQQGKPQKGAIYVINLNDSLPKPKNLTTTFSSDDFHPHGISLCKDTDGKQYLYVLNHRLTLKISTVEIFEVKKDSALSHVETIVDDSWLISPNDIVAVGKKQFYFTNDHDSEKGLKRSIGDYLRLKSGYVVYYDGKHFSKESEGIRYPNGINVSLDGKNLFVASSSGQEIQVFSRADTGKLTPTDVMDIGTGVDNIEIAPDGVLWVGCHPKLLAFTQHASSSEKLSPSQVIKISYKGLGNFSQEEIYMNNGEELSGSSVGTVFGNKLLIGSVFENHILLAKFPR